MEVNYYWCTAFMILIHAGFMMYEMGASRVEHTLAAVTKNVLAFAFKKMGILRAGDDVQEVAMDVEIVAMAYPEDRKSSRKYE